MEPDKKIGQIEQRNISLYICHTLCLRLYNIRLTYMFAMYDCPIGFPDMFDLKRCLFICAKCGLYMFFYPG